MFVFLVIIITLIFFVLIYSLYVFLKLYHKKSQQYLKDLENVKYNYEKNLLNAQIEIQEQTFQNISREIHDNIGQKLSLSKLYLNVIDPEVVDVSQDKIDASLMLISEVMRDLNDISRCLSAELILDDGLLKALEFEIKQLEKLNKYEIRFIINGEYTFFDNRKELIIFRIVQEAINNILKHANSKSIDITLNFTNELMNLEIKDNGIGCKLNQVNGKGAGMNNMANRATMIGGHLSIMSNTSEGTCIQIQVPYDTENQKN